MSSVILNTLSDIRRDFQLVQLLAQQLKDEGQSMLNTALAQFTLQREQNTQKKASLARTQRAGCTLPTPPTPLALTHSAHTLAHI